jgi:hypothetical protein
MPNKVPPKTCGFHYNQTKAMFISFVTQKPLQWLWPDIILEVPACTLRLFDTFYKWVSKFGTHLFVCSLFNDAFSVAQTI